MNVTADCILNFLGVGQNIHNWWGDDIDEDRGGTGDHTSSRETNLRHNSGKLHSILDQSVT